MPEDVCEVGHAAPLPHLYRLVEGCAGLEGPSQRRIEVLDDDVEVDGRPVPPVVACWGFQAGDGQRPLALGEQVDGRRGTEQLRPAVAVTAPGPKSEGTGVEVDGPLEVWDVDADAELRRQAVARWAARARARAVKVTASERR